MSVHPTAIVAEGARLAHGVVVGPYCLVGAGVELAEGVELIGHVSVTGLTRIGEGTRVWPFASLGSAPQDLKYRGEATRLEIGARCMIREHVTMNTGTAGGGGLTRVGDGGLFMMSSHVAHDCQVGQGVIMANNAVLAGHVRVGDFAIIGGNSAVHQWCRIGQHAMVGGMTGVERDVIPYGSVLGDRAELGGLNLVGLKRRGFERDEINALRHAYRALFEGDGRLVERAERLRPGAEGPVAELLDFILAESDRSFCLPRAD